MHGAYGENMPHCPACRRSPELRRDWGCDAESTRDLCRYTCTACNGSGVHNREVNDGDDVDLVPCERCEGTGNLGLRRCPASQADRDIATAFEFYLRVESGVWPARGGLLDQSASFYEFVRIADAERGAIERETRRDQEAAQRRTFASQARR